MDVTFHIDQVPIRYFTDDSDAPRKNGFFKRNAGDSLFVDDDRQPVMWRFVVEPTTSEEGEDRVLFIGYNVYQEKISQWVFRPSMPTLHSIGEEPPAATQLPAVDVQLIDEEGEDGATRAADDLG